MKNIKLILLLIVSSLLLTGCVKYDASMDIKKDKSMEFKAIYAVDTTYFGNQSAVDEDQKARLENAGFKFEEYSEGTMKGYTISKKYSNIDNNSALEDITYNLSAMLDNANDNDKMFKVTKSFIKNTYKAKFTFNSDDNSLSYNDNDNLLALNDDETNNNDIDPVLTIGSTSDDPVTSDDVNNDEEQNEEENDSDIDLSALSSAMDLKFSVSLPYSAKSNNATAVNDNNKKLSWDLVSGSENLIEFEFELYNMNNIYIVVGAGVVALLLIIVIISRGKRKNLVPMEAPVDDKNAVSTANETPVVNEAPVVNETPVAPIADITPTTNETPIINDIPSTNEVKPEITFINETPETPVINKEPEMSPVNEDINSDPRITFNNINVSNDNNQETNN